MKRFFTLLAAFSMVLLAMAQNSGIMLSYNQGEKLKFYHADQLAQAIEEAEVNDTIYFGAGTYSLSNLPQNEYYSSSSHRQLTKPLTFIGVGAESSGTILSSSYLTMNIDPNIEDASKRKITFEGIRFQNRNELYVASNVTELKFINCYGRFYDYNRYFDVEDYKVDNLIIDRCDFDYIDLSGQKIGKANVKNSKIGSYLYGSCSDNDAAFMVDHCYINYIQSSFKGLIEHSIIYYDYASSENVLNDCYYYYSGDEYSSKNNCQKLPSPSASSYDDDPSSLGECSDETVYGSLGGNNPYTLYPQYPTPDASTDSDGKYKSFIDYDSDNKKLTIKVTLLGQKDNSSTTE